MAGATREWWLANNRRRNLTVIYASTKPRRKFVESRDPICGWRRHTRSHRNSAHRKVQNSNDLPQGLPIISGSSVEDNTIKIDVSGISDEDGVGQFTYQWERSSDAARWTPYQTNSSNPALMRLNQPEVGFAYRAIVSYVDAFGTTETLVTPATNMVQNIDDPVEGEVMVVGQSKKGQRLQIDTSNLSDDDGIANVRSTWEMSDNGRSWVSVPDVYGNSMTLAQAHVGSLIRVRAVVVDNFGSETTLYSQPTSLIQNVNSKPKVSFEFSQPAVNLTPAQK